ncbi:AlbA family DNA-binding domain-containing protein [Paenibacillus wulumuqiensis]|uniref:AlbA family DNA-binding domain-containing protein n=1 Tax=Paenibacillus wulumuqiensis TaxID=1567107 RepID=UPI000619E51A|nr:ATP-binding protein [Paenibacillus wulumuqiensis]
MLNTSDILNISRQIKAGAQYENPRRELKREFWKVFTKENKRDEEGQSEFVKDLTAMVNTPGPDAYFIIGIDGETGEIYDTRLPIDSAKLTDIIYRKLQDSFDVNFHEIKIDDKYVVVVHIPQSFNKPHVIRRHKNIECYIPVRKGTRTNPATRYDLDLMYNEKDKIIVPPFKLELFHNSSFYNFTLDEKKRLNIIANIINVGTHINLLAHATLFIINEQLDATITIGLGAFWIPGKNSNWIPFTRDNFAHINPNEILRINLSFGAISHIIDNIIHEITQGISYKAYLSIEDMKGNLSQTEILPFLIR